MLRRSLLACAALLALPSRLFAQREYPILEPTEDGVRIWLRHYDHDFHAGVTVRACEAQVGDTVIYRGQLFLYQGLDRT